MGRRGLLPTPPMSCAFPGASAPAERYFFTKNKFFISSVQAVPVSLSFWLPFVPNRLTDAMLLVFNQTVTRAQACHLQPYPPRIDTAFLIHGTFLSRQVASAPGLGRRSSAVRRSAASTTRSSATATPASTLGCAPARSSDRTPSRGLAPPVPAVPAVASLSTSLRSGLPAPLRSRLSAPPRRMGSPASTPLSSRFPRRNTSRLISPPAQAGWCAAALAARLLAGGRFVLNSLAYKSLIMIMRSSVPQARCACHVRAYCLP